MKCLVLTSILKVPLRWQDIKIADNTVKYIKNVVFRVAKFIFEVGLIVTSTNEGQQRAET